MKKTAISLILILSISTSLLGACGKDDSTTDNTTDNATSEPVAMETSSDPVTSTTDTSFEPPAAFTADSPWPGVSTDVEQSKDDGTTEQQENTPSIVMDTDTTKSEELPVVDAVPTPQPTPDAEKTKQGTQVVDSTEEVIVGPSSTNTGEDECPTTIQNIEATPDTSLNLFNWRFFDTLDTNKNQFYSPYSIEQTLALLGNGADQNTVTRAEIVQALQAGPIENLNQYFQITTSENILNNMFDNLPNFASQNLIVGNTAGTSYYKDEAFIKELKKSYFVDVIYDNFATNLMNVMLTVSNWVNAATYGYIPAYNAQINPQSSAAVVNTIYFKGNWDKSFETTTSAAATDVNNIEKSVDMMSDTLNIRYYKDDKFRGIAIPYKQNNDGKMSMFVILPVDKEDLAIGEKWKKEDPAYRREFIKKLASSTTTNIYASLPKFTMETSVDRITDNIKALGINYAFSDASEIRHFLGYLTTLKVADIFHKTKIEVNEKGVTAAAVTEADMSKDISETAEELEALQFECNIPFVFVIRDEKHGVDMFTGIINEF